MENNNQEVPYRIKAFFRSARFWKPFIGILAGALIGFLYFYFIGCKTGACAITSNPLSSIVMGSLLGFLVTGTDGFPKK